MGFDVEVTGEAFDQAAEFIWLHARLLERRVFGALFGGAPRDLAVEALHSYQNPDGGFGNALEPDKRCPESQPVDVEVALRVLDRLGATQERYILRACDWLASIATAAGGVPFSLPTLNGYPHMPWWEAPENPPASLNPTAAIAGLLHRFGVTHPWRERATRYCYDAIAAWEGTEFHTAMPVATFLEHAPDRSWAARELDRLMRRLDGTIELDPDAEGYVQLPHEWAPRPNSPLRPLFDDETMRLHLLALRARQRADGGWPISWSPPSRTAEAEWRGVRTVDALVTLRAYA